MIVTLKQGLSSQLPVSAPTDTLLYLTDTGEYYMGTGTGLRRFKSILMYPSLMGMPTVGDTNYLYFDLTDRMLYLYDTGTSLYTQIVFTNHLEWVNIPSSMVLDVDYSGKVLTTKDAIGSIVKLTLPTVTNEVSFKVIHEADIPCVLNTEDGSAILVQGIGTCDGFTLNKDICVDVVYLDGKWMLTKTTTTELLDINSYTMLNIVQEKVKGSDIAGGVYNFRHFLNYKYVKTIVYNDTRKELVPNTVLTAYDKDTSSVKFMDAVDPTHLFTFVGGLGPIEDKIIHGQLKTSYLNIRAHTHRETVRIDYTNYSVCVVDLKNDITIKFNVLKQDGVRKLFLVIKQSPTVKYDVQISDEGYEMNDLGYNISEIIDTTQHISLSPEIGQTNVLMLAWNGSKFVI